MNRDTKNTRLWKLFDQRDCLEQLTRIEEININRNDIFDSEIDKLLRD